MSLTMGWVHRVTSFGGLRIYPGRLNLPFYSEVTVVTVFLENNAYHHERIYPA